MGGGGLYLQAGKKNTMSNSILINKLHGAGLTIKKKKETIKRGA